MIRITSRAPSNKQAATHYAVAGQVLTSQSEVRGLSAFVDGNASSEFSALLDAYKEPELPSREGVLAHYLGQAFFEGRLRTVAYRRHGRLGQLDVGRVPTCLIDFDDSHIHVLNDEPLGEGLNFEVVTGPALVLLLAQYDVYCLHAGCVDTKAGRVGVMAESGVGKSTLSANGGDEWSQVSDDIMPFCFNAGSTPVVMPAFPQLKLQNKVVAGFPKLASSLDYLIRLKPEASTDIQFSVLPKIDAMLQIVRHTVAAKLFDDNNLQKHASFARHVASSVTVVEVSYPRNLEQLPYLRESIVEYLGAL